MFARLRLTLSFAALWSVLALSSASLGDDEKKAEEKTDDRLVCIGALAGAHIYTTYGYIGAVADAYSHEVYKVDKVQALIRTLPKAMRRNFGPAPDVAQKIAEKIPFASGPLVP